MMTYLLGGAMPEYPTLAALLRRRHRRRAEAGVLPGAAPAPRARRRDGSARATRPLERGKIYEGGNLHDLERALGVTGDRILYVGDHIYGDILRSKKESAWRTAMIIQEMEAEVARIRVVPRRLRDDRARSRSSARARGRAPLLPGALSRISRVRSSTSGAKHRDARSGQSSWTAPRSG